MKISLMLHTLVVIAVAVFLAGFGLGYAAHGSPAPSPAVKAAVAAADVATVIAARAETVYVHAAQTSTRWQTVYDTARVHDTVTVDSIVYVDRDIADSTIHACRDALSSCAAALAAKDVALARKDSVIAAKDAARPSKLRELVKDAALFGGGYAVGRAGFTVRIPFR